MSQRNEMSGSDNRRLTTTIYLDSRVSGPSAMLVFRTRAQAREFLDEQVGKWADAMDITLDTHEPAATIAGTLAEVRCALASPRGGGAD